jgi:ATP adenylyltransferase
MKYIQKNDDGNCFFCTYIAEKKDRQNLILHRGETCFTILNRFPYNVGHLMVTPNAHKGTLKKLTPVESLELMSSARDAQAAMDRAFKPDGYNLGINLGRVAGAGVPGHIHLHLVPRWKGDTNFMPVTGETKVHPVSLSEVYRKLKKGWKE